MRRTRRTISAIVVLSCGLLLTACAQSTYLAEAKIRSERDTKQSFDDIRKVNSDYLARHPVRQSSKLTLAESDAGLLGASHSDLLMTCQHMPEVIGLEDLYETLKLKENTLAALELTYWDGDQLVYDAGGHRDYYDRSDCVESKRKYEHALAALYEDLRGLKNMGY